MACWNNLRDSDFVRIEESQNFQSQKNSLHDHDMYPLSKVSLEPTCLGQEFKSRSAKCDRVPVDYEISFEVSFMDEHLDAFEKQTQKMMDFLQSQNKKINDKFSSNQQPEQSEIDNIENEAPSYLTEKENKQFQRDLESQQKLSQFIALIRKELKPQIFEEIKMLIFMGWQKYIETRNRLAADGINISSKPKQEFQKMAEQFANNDCASLLASGKIKFLKLAKIGNAQSSGQIQFYQKFREYLKFIYETVLLIVEEYFENPFSQQQGRKEGTDEDRKRERIFNLQFYGDGFSQSEESDFYLNLPYKKNSRK